jgi:hypothetical protein
MISILFIVITAVFFAICVLYTRALNRIASPDSAEASSGRGTGKD